MVAKKRKMEPVAIAGWTAIVIILVAVASTSVFLRDRRGGRCPTSVPIYAHGKDSQGTIAIVGDLQRTSWIEHVLLAREQNDDDRVRLIAAIAKERPSMVVLLGDLVFEGASCGDWADLDNVLAPVRRLDVPVLAVPGNHEYSRSKTASIAEFHARFPVSGRSHWYSRRHGQLALVWLDSNKDKLKKAQWNTQRQWFEQTLQQLDADPQVRGVFVFTHHPPYTNSIVTKDERHVQESVVEPFVAAKKTLAFISGHAHGYERFIERGKYFVVSAGGGGPRVQYLSDGASRHRDDYRGPVPRPFNYLLVTDTQRGAKLVARGFNKGETEIKQLDSVDMPFLFTESILANDYRLRYPYLFPKDH